jgi:hypothetical protein
LIRSKKIIALTCFYASFRQKYAVARTGAPSPDINLVNFYKLLRVRSGRSVGGICNKDKQISRLAFKGGAKTAERFHTYLFHFALPQANSRRGRKIGRKLQLVRILQSLGFREPSNIDLYHL